MPPGSPHRQAECPPLLAIVRSSPERRRPRGPEPAAIHIVHALRCIDMCHRVQASSSTRCRRRRQAVVQLLLW
jgi:hypothetical protein